MKNNQETPEEEEKELAEDKVEEKREKSGDKPPRESLGKLLRRIQKEYKNDYDHIQEKRKKWEANLKVYSNQKKDPTSVGDTTLFSIMQTVLASVYSDKLSVEFIPRTEGDTDFADNLNAMAELDYVDMRKDEIDFFWIWNTCFYGHALISLEEYKRDTKHNIFHPVPQIIDPLTFLRDKNAVSVKGIGSSGKGAMKHGGRMLKMTGYEVLNHPSFYDDINLVELDTDDTIDAISKDAKRARDEVQNRTDNVGDGISDELESKEFDVIEWFTLYYEGEPKRVKVWMDGKRTKILGFKYCEDNEFPLLDKMIYPMSDDWDGISIPDIVEDKTRAKAIITNLALKSVKADVYPMYLYDDKIINNRNDLGFDFNKFIPGSSGTRPISSAIAPFPKAQTNFGLINYILNALDESAEKATATPDIQQGIAPDEQRTLGETNLVASRSDTRFSLSAKIFGFSEKEFWKMWLKRTLNNFTDNIDEKVLRIEGEAGAKWRKVTREDIETEVMPDIKIVSKFEARSELAEKRALLSQYFQFALQEPTINKRYGLKKLAKVYDLDREEINKLFPQTPEELIADRENDLLNDDKQVNVKPTDDHLAHIERHSYANATTSTMAHIETHKEALALKQENQQLFPQDNIPQDNIQQEQGQESQQINPMKKSPSNMIPKQIIR